MSYKSLRYHIVSATKCRRRFITARVEPFLFTALRRKIEELGGKAFIINGDADHVHIVCSIPGSMAVDTFVATIKGHACRVVRKRGFEFEWQKGFAAFTVSAFEMDGLLDYVRNQKQHHARGTTRDELEDA